MAKPVSRSNSFLVWFKNLSIGKKLASGFGIVFFIFVALVIFIQYKLTVQDELQTQIVEQRFPTSIAGHDLVNGINASLAALRGYMILGTDTFKQQRLQAWEEIDKNLATLTKNSSNWTKVKDITALKDLKSVMAEYKSAQQTVEEISQSEDERPATKILINQASPHARKIISAINRMLNAEKKLPATAERKELFGILSDSRGSFSLALTSIRSYLISADQKTIDLFNKRWRINTSKLKAIQKRVDLLNEKQLELFKTYVDERSKFEPLATRMLEIRGSNKWNMANYLLAKEAAPRAVKALEILASIVDNQNKLVAQDVKTLQSESASIKIISVIATIVTLIIGLLIARLITVNIVTSFAKAISVTKRIASGDLSGKIVINSSDETGQLLTSLQQMQQQLINVIERDVQSIVDTAKEGDLAKRIQLDGKEGFYEKLSSSINELVDVNEQVIEDTVRMFGALANGDLTQRIDADYQGAFNKLKQDANQTVQKLTQVIEGDMQSMVDASLNGDLNQRIDLSDKQGFFESMSQGINNLVESVNLIFQDASSSMKSMSQGDLTHPIDRHYHGQFDELKNNINETLSNLDKTMTTLIESGQSISSISSEISDGNKSLSTRTEHQASSLEQTASSMEELTSIVKNNAENSYQAVQLAKEAQLTAVQGGEIMQHASVAMTEINHSSEKIAEIIGVIDEIAFQTNLLALNASVEAARAGEQGRGFAVVATEVRNLAGRSATAAKEIKGLINDSGEKVKSGVTLIEKSATSQNEIVESISRVENIISEISNASQEQSDGIEQVNTAVTSMDEVTQQNAALAEQTSASAVSLTDKASEMSDLMNFFTVSQSSTYRPESKVFSATPATTISSTKQTSPPVTAITQTTDTSETENDDWEEF